MVEDAGRDNRSAGEVADAHGHMLHNDVEADHHVGYYDAARVDGCGPEVKVAHVVQAVDDPESGIDVDNEVLHCQHLLGLERVQVQNRHECCCHDHDDAGLEEVLYQTNLRPLDLDPASVLGLGHQHYH
mmetsp:Transcript_8856/g.13400  ORF Transcript_8856/g.13400 Transcript_8856/m.13400 type:complete len:129 (-) Transcript_8856:78-464(-)